MYVSSHVGNEKQSEILLANHTSWIELVDEFRSRLTRLDDIVILILCALYIIVFIIGLIGNSLIAYISSKNKFIPQHLQQNRMLINLCIADLMVIVVCCPTAIYTNVTKIWTFGWIVCKLSYYLQGVAVTAGIFSLTALSLDRYLMVHRISVFRKISRRHLSVILISILWILALFIPCPILYVRNTHELKMGRLEVAFCYERWNSESTRRSYAISTLIIVYILPCAILLICHASVSCTLCTVDRIEPRNQSMAMSDVKSGVSRIQTYCSHVSERGTSSSRLASVVSLDSNGHTYTQTFRTRRRLANVLMGLTSCFVACWLPYNFSSLYLDLHPNHNVALILPFTLLLGHAHSAINPIVYWLLNKSARNKMQNVIRFRSSTTAKQSHLMPAMCFRFNLPSSTSTDVAMMKFHPHHKQSSNLCLSY